MIIRKALEKDCFLKVEVKEVGDNTKDDTLKMTIKLSKQNERESFEVIKILNCSFEHNCVCFHKCQIADPNCTTLKATGLLSCL